MEERQRLSRFLDRRKLGEELYRLFTLEVEEGALLDEHGRVLYRHSGGARRDLAVAEKLVEMGFKPEWPRGKSFAVCLTHDVDWALPPHRHVRRAASRILRRGALRQLPRWLLGRKLAALNPYALRRLADVEERYGATSTFFVKATPPGWLDPRYEEYYDLSILSGEFERLISGGWEVALHGGYRSHDDAARLAAERRTLEEACGRRVVGVRMHYLRFRYPDTWLAVERAGFAYDGTLGFPDSPGYRNGLCYPFKPLVGGRFLSILEIPLAVMDTTLYAYMRLNPAQALETVRMLARRVEALRGVLTILWHNSTVEPLYEGGERLYKALLSHFVERGAWIASCEELCEYWVSNVW